MNQQKRKDATDLSRGEPGSRFEKMEEQGRRKSLFQLVLEVEDLLEKQKLKPSLWGNPIRTGYVE
jgi:hypothetical protein